MNNEFNKDYFENGLVTGISCYTNYRWMPELTIKMAHKIIKHLNMEENQVILDYGCAKGFLVKAMRILDIDAYGCDISDYAISQIDGDIKEYCCLTSDCQIPAIKNSFDLIITKDVLEHMDEEEINLFLKNATPKSKKMFHIIPLGNGEKFVVPEYELDKTHKLAKSREWWEDKFKSFGWDVVFSYKIKGVKDNWTEKYEHGNGFFILEKKHD